MMQGGYSRRPGGGGEDEPRVVQIAIDRARMTRPGSGKPLELFVSVHMEATPLTWRQLVEVSPSAQERLLELTQTLYLWSVDKRGTPTTGRAAAIELGETLERTFLGPQGCALLASLHPTAVMLSADETLLNLPWEAIRCSRGVIGRDVPFGRIVATGMVPAARRDVTAEDPTVRILVVANPTNNLPGSEDIITTLEALRGAQPHGMVEVDVLSATKATRAGFADAVAGRDYDIIHFAGHGAFDKAAPDRSCVVFADGVFSAGDVDALKWSAPPYIVFNSACESARAAAGRRLISKSGNVNGLVAAFLAAGTEAYIGHFWPVKNHSAAAFSDAFYRGLFELQNVGTAITRAREFADAGFDAEADLAAPGTIFFGDAGTAQRRDTATAAGPPDAEPSPPLRRDIAKA